MHTVTDPKLLQPAEQAVVELAAANRGKFEIASRSDTRGVAVRGGKHKLYDPSDSDYARRCCDAVPRLIEMQLVRQAEGNRRFELTNFGWQLSRKLTNDKRKAGMMGEPSPNGVTQPLPAGVRDEPAIDATLARAEAAIGSAESPSREHREPAPVPESVERSLPDVTSWEKPDSIEP